MLGEWRLLPFKKELEEYHFRIRVLRRRIRGKTVSVNFCKFRKDHHDFSLAEQRPSLYAL